MPPLHKELIVVRNTENVHRGTRNGLQHAEEGDDERGEGDAEVGLEVCNISSSTQDDEIETVATTTTTTSTASLASLCLCMLTHSYLLISVFPYSGFMAIDLIDSVNEENAGSYAGLIASSFMIGRATTAYMWGKAADLYGRTTVLYLSLGAACIFSICFGLAPSFGSALAFRFCLGAWNGLMGTVKTAASDIAKGNEKQETKAMQQVIGMWAWGFLISPGISGALAEPIRQYPHVEWLQNNDALKTILTRHPFLLPNLLGSALCLLAMLCVWLFIEESVPAEKRRSVKYIVKDLFDGCRACLPSSRCGCTRLIRPYHSIPEQHKDDDDVHRGAAAVPAVKEGGSSISDCGDVSTDSSSPRKLDSSAPTDTSTASVASIFARKRTRTTLMIYWIYSFVGLSLDEIFPLFCISHRAGLGLDEMQIGQILSVCGLIFASSQYFMYPLVYNRFGLHGAIRVGAMLSAPIMMLTPVSLLLNRGADEGELRPAAFWYLAIVLATSKLFALVFFSSISVAVNQSVPFEHRGTVNGLSVQGGSVAKGVGPTFAGVLVTVSVSVFGKAGSVLTFGVVGLLGGILTLLAFLYLEEGDSDDNTTSLHGDACDKEAGEGLELVKNDSLEDCDEENR